MIASVAAIIEPDWREGTVLYRPNAMPSLNGEAQGTTPSAEASGTAAALPAANDEAGEISQSEEENIAAITHLATSIDADANHPLGRVFEQIGALRDSAAVADQDLLVERERATTFVRESIALTGRAIGIAKRSLATI
ncbi:unnamed protein product [Zymoseptoria tritici ST99CH_1A5]|nr:unnamed protein product [Zymoseptoria tritici ST99CH_1A5]